MKIRVKNICCIGAGYVGGPTMAVIALKCPEIKIRVVDINEDKIKKWNGPLDNLPIYEPGLKEIVNQTRGKNLFFSNDIDLAIRKSEMIFMAVNTPTKTDGEGAGMAADLKYFESSAKDIARIAENDKIVVEKSTLPVRTAEKIKEILEKNSNGPKFEIISNPEFLAEGTAIEDLFKSDRVLIGGESTISGQKAVEALVDIYSRWIPREKILRTNVWSSELSKLASNAMLAQRISSINSLSALCEKTGANINELSKAIGMDHRIGSKFLEASVGFGGSCFQKDILNLVYLCKHYGLNEVAEYWHQVVKINDYQKFRFAKKIIEGLGGTCKNKTISLLGWSFKKNTKDSRESSSIYVADYLLQSGAKLNIYDPMVGKDQIIKDISNLCISRDDTPELIEDTINRCHVFKSYVGAFQNSDAIAILTEWDEFREIFYDKNNFNNTNQPRVYDGRNIIDKNKTGFEIKSIGK